MRKVLAAGVLLAMTTATAVAVDPDAVREKARPMVPAAGGNGGATPSPAQQAAALSDAFRKFSSSHMLAWKLSVSGNLMIMGQFSSARHCAEARKMLRRQVVRYGWGRTECLEVMLP